MGPAAIFNDYHDIIDPYERPDLSDQYDINLMALL